MNSYYFASLSLIIISTLSLSPGSLAMESSTNSASEKTLQPTAIKVNDRKCPVCQIESSNKCTGCERTFYCSKQHQVADWIRHKPECTRQTEQSRAKLDLSHVSDFGVTTTAFRYPNLINALLIAEQRRETQIENGKRRVLILGPGISSENAGVPQLHELAPFFAKDHITVVDKYHEVKKASEQSEWGTELQACAESVIDLDSNYGALGTSQAKKVKAELKRHVARIPKTLKELDLKFEIADFSDYQLEPNSIDILVATKSLMYAMREDPLVAIRYLSALRMHGVAYVTLEEFLMLINFQGVNQTPNQFADHKQMKKDFPDGRQLQLGDAIFELLEIAPFTTNAQGGTWAVYFLRPEHALAKRTSFANTCPIFELTRIK